MEIFGSANSCVSMYRSPKDNFGYELVPASLAVPSVACEMRGKWLYNYCFVECCFQDLLKIACNILVLFSSIFFFKCLVKVQVVQPLNSTDMATPWQNFPFLLERSGFHTVNKIIQQELTPCKNQPANQLTNQLWRRKYIMKAFIDMFEFL